MDYRNMSPEDAFIAGIKAAMKMTADMGRSGDTQLAHINDQEADILKAHGGSGTINPHTGLREYKFGGTGNPGREAERANDRDRGDRGVGSREAAERAGQNRAFDQRQESQRAGREGVATNPGFGGIDPTGPTGDAGDSGGGAPDDRSLGERIVDGLLGGLSSSFREPANGELGFLEGPIRAVPGVGQLYGVTQFARSLGLEGIPDFGNPDADQRDGRQDTGILSPPAPQPKSTPRYPWSRPTSEPISPAGLNLDPQMTNLQRRSAIATGGVGSQQGIYRDPAIQDFYRNLALYDLLGPNNQPAPNAQVLPVERQYMQQVFGGQPGNTTEDFLRALSAA